MVTAVGLVDKKHLHWQDTICFLNKLSWEENVDERELTICYQEQYGIELYSKPLNLVPNHVNCRCVIVPRLEISPVCKKVLRRFKSYQWEEEK